MWVFDFTDLKWYKIILEKFVSLSGFSMQQQRKKEVEIIGRKENEQKESCNQHTSSIMVVSSANCFATHPLHFPAFSVLRIAAKHKFFQTLKGSVQLNLIHASHTCLRWGSSTFGKSLCSFGEDAGWNVSVNSESFATAPEGFSSSSSAPNAHHAAWQEGVISLWIYSYESEPFVFSA